MAIDFPGSPSTGQRHSHNNTTWEWDGSSWNRITIDLYTTDAATLSGIAATQFARRDDDNIITGVTTFIGNGYAGVGNTVLIVEGDARVTGVLSVGQGSLAINERDIYAAGVVTATTFVGALTGNVTGNVSGSAGSATGNAATATALQNARTIGGVSFDGTANINLPGVNAAGNQNTSGNAATAGKLQTARTIGGVSFDGSANINLPGVNAAGNQNTTGTAALAEGLTGTPDITVRNVTVTGIQTAEDVKNIDSVGIITARTGIDVTGGTFKADGLVGAAGSVLSTTGSGIHWVSPLTGPQGAQGRQGAQGAQGAAGVAGAQGAQGRQGTAGSSGGTGPQGVQGAVGAQGHQGVQGATGAQGHQGVQGAQGHQGHQGVQGAANATTINNNANNRVITGSGTANTLEGEANMTFDGTTLRVNNEGRLNASYVQVLADGTNPCVKLEGYNNNNSVGRIAWLITNQYSAGSMELYHWREGMNSNGSLNIARGNNNARGGDVLAKFYYDGDTALGIGQTSAVGIGTTNPTAKLNVIGNAVFGGTGTGIVTATKFVGDGSDLTGISGVTINNNADNRIITGSGTAATLNGESTFTYDGTNVTLTKSSGTGPYIYFNTTNQFIRADNSGNMTFRTNAGQAIVEGSAEARIQGGSSGLMGVRVMGSPGYAQLFYSQNEKLVTMDSGVKVTGITSTTNLKVVGVSTFSEVVKFDANVSSTPSASGNVHIYRHDNKLKMCGGSGIQLEEGGFTRWHLISGALHPHGTTYNNLGNSSNRVGNLFIQTSVDLVDNAKLKIGTGDDCQIYHDGSHNIFLGVNGADFKIKDASNNSAIFDTSAGVELFNAGSKKFETTSSGISVTGSVIASSNVQIGDSDEFIAGDGNDLRLWHNADSYIKNYTGDLYIQGDGDDINMRAADDINIYTQTSDKSIVCVGDGGVELYYNDSKKFETNSTGIIVTGEVNSTSGIFEHTTNHTTQLIFQASNETRLYHGSNAQIKLSFRGTGDVYRGAVNADATGISLLTGASSEEYGIRCVADAQTELYYNNEKMFDTQGDGCNIYDNDANVNLYFRTSGGTHRGHIYADSNNHFGFQTADNEWGMYCQAGAESALYYDGNTKLATTSSGVQVTGTTDSTSDIKLKENVKTIENSLDKVLKLRGVEFDWKESKEHSIGVIAQEVEEVLPELVHETDDIKAVSYGNLTAVLIEAIKEQNEIINNMKKEIEALKNS